MLHDVTPENQFLILENAPACPASHSEVPSELRKWYEKMGFACAITIPGSPGAILLGSVGEDAYAQTPGGKKNVPADFFEFLARRKPHMGSAEPQARGEPKSEK